MQTLQWVLEAPSAADNYLHIRKSAERIFNASEATELLAFVAMQGMSDTIKIKEKRGMSARH